jgi:hypothetical protein
MNELELANALRRLNDATVPPPVDPAREAALMQAMQRAFDAAPATPPRSTRVYWYMTALAAAAVLLIAAVLPTVPVGHRGPPSSTTRDVQPGLTEFVVVPGAEHLPPIESGTLLRTDLPVSMLPSLGLTPPSAGRATVKADLVIGQDGLTRAVRLVN